MGKGRNAWHLPSSSVGEVEARVAGDRGSTRGEYLAPLMFPGRKFHGAVTHVVFFIEGSESRGAWHFPTGSVGEVETRVAGDRGSTRGEYLAPLMFPGRKFHGAVTHVVFFIEGSESRGAWHFPVGDQFRSTVPRSVRPGDVGGVENSPRVEPRAPVFAAPLGAWHFPAGDQIRSTAPRSVCPGDAGGVEYSPRVEPRAPVFAESLGAWHFPTGDQIRSTVPRIVCPGVAGGVDYSPRVEPRAPGDAGTVNLGKPFTRLVGFDLTDGTDH